MDAAKRQMFYGFISHGRGERCTDVGGANNLKQGQTKETRAWQAIIIIVETREEFETVMTAIAPLTSVVAMAKHTTR